MSTIDPQRRLVSGMRPNGSLHLGHYYGLLKDWTRLQHEYDCFFCIADWQALSTQFESASKLNQNTLNLAIDWLAAGVSPSSATFCVQSLVPEYAELYLLLSMLCPSSWLERIPGRREKQELRASLHKDQLTHGIQGYPLLEAVNALLYRAGHVSISSERVPQVELTRDIAHRFNQLYGQEEDLEARVHNVIRKLGKKLSKLYLELRRAYQEQGDLDALERARALIKEQQNITLSDQQRLQGYLDGSGKIILPAPNALKAVAGTIAGLDGKPMSGRSANALYLRDTPKDIEEKIRTMPTDPARVRRCDPGDPERCPVWPMHRLHSAASVGLWVEQGCRTASIGCLECKTPLIDAMKTELAPLWERALDYEQNLDLVQSILVEGSGRARAEAKEVLIEVRQAMGLGLGL